MFRTILHLVVAYDVVLSFPFPIFPFPHPLSRFHPYTMSYNAGKFYSSIHHDKMVYIVVVVRFSLHKHITVADFTSLFFFNSYAAAIITFRYYSVFVLLCCRFVVSFFLPAFRLWLFSCFAVLRYLSIWSEKTFAFLRLLIFRSYPFCVFVVMIPLYSSSWWFEWDTFYFVYHL